MFIQGLVSQSFSESCQTVHVKPFWGKSARKEEKPEHLTWIQTCLHIIILTDTCTHVKTVLTRACTLYTCTPSTQNKPTQCIFSPEDSLCFLLSTDFICSEAELSDRDWSWAAVLNLCPQGSSVQTHSSPSPLTLVTVTFSVTLYSNVRAHSENYFYLNCFQLRQSNRNSTAVFKTLGKDTFSKIKYKESAQFG